MATVKQIDANRRNAQKSTGPTTPQGKQQSSRNALKSGIYSESEVIAGEDPLALDELEAEYYDHYRPATPQARELVDSLIRNAWLLRRFASIESAIFASDPPVDGSLETRITNRFNGCLRSLDLLQRRINAAERNFHRSLQAIAHLPAPDAVQPSDSVPASEKLASFLQTPVPTPETAPDPQPAAPENEQVHVNSDNRAPVTFPENSLPPAAQPSNLVAADLL